jgi:deoxyribose-phosphate aldolase
MTTETRHTDARQTSARQAAGPRAASRFAALPIPAAGAAAALAGAIVLDGYGALARAFLRTTLVLVAVSLAFPLAAGHTAIATRLTLALAHLIAAGIVIPVLTLRLVRTTGADVNTHI